MRDIILLWVFLAIIIGLLLFLGLQKEWLWFLVIFVILLCYLLFLWPIYSLISFKKFLSFLNTTVTVKWWQTILFPFLMIIMLKIIDKIKTRIKKTSKKNNRGFKIDKKGKEFIKWHGENKKFVGKSNTSFTPDNENNGSFLVSPDQAGTIIGLDLLELDDSDRPTGAWWDTNIRTRHWCMAIFDQKTGERFNEEKEINKFVKKDSKLIIYVAKAMGFNGKKYQLIIKFSRGPVKKLTTRVPN